MKRKFSETEPCYQDKIASDITRLYLLGDSESVDQAIDLLLKQKPIDIANLSLLVQRYIENEAADGYEETAGQEWWRCLEYHYVKVEAVEFFKKYLVCCSNYDPDWYTRENVKNWLIEDMKKIGIPDEDFQNQVKKLVNFDYWDSLFWDRCKEVMMWVLDAYNYYSEN